jgi:WD40 repeat protein
VLAFSNGGQYFAIAANVNVLVYDTRSLKQLTSFQGHMMTIKSMSWSYSDECVFTAGIDGHVYGWPLRSQDRLEMSGTCYAV